MDLGLKELAEKQAEFCRIFGNTSRILIMWNLADQELSVSEISSRVGISMQNTSQHLSLLKELSLKDVSIQIMAPITSKNLEVANQFSKYFEVRHVPVNYLKITIVDAEHMFQSRATYENNNYYFPQFLDSYYTNNQEYISNRKKVLTNLWKTSKPPSFVTLKAVSKYSESKMSSQPYKLVHDTIKQIDGPIIVKEEKSSKKLQKTEIIKLSNYAKRHPETNFSGGITRTYGVMGQAIVRPPRELNLLAGCFINDNLILTKKDNISIKLTGKNLFCGWSIDIPLPNDYVIPPCSILLEGYGKAKPNILEMQYPSGYKLWDAYNGIEAFVTFFHPLAKYSGPGTDGHIAKDNYQELYQPYSND
ncbi:MAG: ArsR family transcriptional regulator [Candidatus Bathyarchaeota archaeon]